MGPFRSIAKLNTWKGWLALVFLSVLTIEATYASVGYGTTQPLLFSLVGGTVFALTARSRYYAVLLYCIILYVRTWIWAPEMGEVHLALGSLAMTISAALPNVVGAVLFHRDEKNAIIDSPVQIARLFTLVLALYLISSAPLYYFFQSEFQTFWFYRMLVDCIGSAASVLLVGMFVTYLITGQEFVVVQSRIPNYLVSLFFVLLPVGLWFFFSEDQQLTRFSLLLAVPAILYLASNFALFWVLLGLILHSVSISLATLFDVGPFYSEDRFSTAVSVQGYMILVVLSAWVIALQRKSQKTAFNAIEAMNNHLEDIIEARTQELRHTNEHLKREVELRNQAEELLRQITLTDPVTELLNRQGLKQTFQSARSRYSDGAIVLVSLENLQEIVENEGYEMADSVIRILAHRIERLVGRERVLARWDDSSFTILLEDHGSDAGALTSILQDISGKLGDPVALGPEALSVEALMIAVPVSALAAEDPDPMSDFFLLAASALQDLRKSDGRYAIASAQKDRSSGTGYKMYQQIKNGLQDGRFLVYYQPIVSSNLDRLLGSEALIRWDNGGQLMGPDTFIAVAERTDLIVDLGYHTLEQVARKARQWNALNLDIYSVNTSIRQLADPDFGRRCLSIWEQHGCSPSSLKIEITESILAMDHPTIRSNLEMLRKAGISIAFDDFGTGFSSLSYLDRFPVDSIKIDRVFVQKLSAGSNSRAVIEAMGLIAQQLKLEVIVEGVEDES
ncbi:MAG: EAL domain-containing protein, partial [Leptospiraceae bacterium]|nr:EAL domain-containing protein [Leptospiraceae bacterium]